MKYVLLIFSVAFITCSHEAVLKEVTVKNPSAIERINETVSLNIQDILDSSDTYKPDDLIIVANNKAVPSQLLDSDGDTLYDKLIFQLAIAPNSEKVYQVKVSGEKADSMPVSTYSRFVPERIDDYAWENDRVAFRTYGPEAQRITESGMPGGTLSSGIDCWLKKVNYPIINSWYKKNHEGGSYHVDSGEGLDNFHVGASRGAGGTGIWDEENKVLVTSGNFRAFKTLAEGPISTLFELDYEAYEALGNQVKVKKNISLDLGSNLTRYEMDVTGAEVLSIGLTLHKNEGEISSDKEMGWFSYWEPHDGSELGTAILADPKIVLGVTEHIVEEADQSHLIVHLKVLENKVVFYAGFTWKDANQFVTPAEWHAYLDQFAKKVASPLELTIQ